MLHARKALSKPLLAAAVVALLLAPPLFAQDAGAPSPPDRAAYQTSPAPAKGNQKNASVSPQQPNGGAQKQQVLRVGSNLVLVRVIVRDAAGNAITNLRPEDFRLFDEGSNRNVPQEITSFVVESAAPVSTPVAVATSNPLAAPAPAVTSSPAVGPRYLAFFFDDVHLQTDELARARKAAEQYITQSLRPGDLVAIFDSSGKGMLDFTADRDKPRDALKDLRSRPAAGLGISSCPAFDEYQADLIDAQNQAVALDAATDEFLHCYYNDDPTLVNQARLYVTGHAGAVAGINRKLDEDSLLQLKEVVGRMSGLRGPRSIVLVSPGFMADALESQLSVLIDAALRAGVTISALDARGLYTADLLADISDDSVALTSIREAAARAESAVMADLASGTGGVFFHKNNDLNLGFRLAAALPDTAYILGFAPSAPQMDGRFHEIRVTLAVPGEFTLQARRGYFAEKMAQSNPPGESPEFAAAPQPAQPPPPPMPPMAQAVPAVAVPQSPATSQQSPLTPPQQPPANTANAPATAPVAEAKPDKSKKKKKKKDENAGFWNPPDVDAPIAGISAVPPCPLADVLQQAAKRAGELVDGLQKFSAQEVMHAQMINEVGGVTAEENQQFEYLVFLSRARNGLLSVRENHTATYGQNAFDRSMTDSGLAVLALIFYPPYDSGYDMRCEGQVQYQGRAAWVIHFQQRPDKPSVTRSFATPTGHYSAALKGRAWIDASSFQVLHLETNLVNWVAGMHLKSEAISIDYGPVQFHIRPVTLWLPQNAEVYSEFIPYSTGSSIVYAEHPENPRYRVRYTFTDFKLFLTGAG